MKIILNKYEFEKAHEAVKNAGNLEVLQVFNNIFSGKVSHIKITWSVEEVVIEADQRTCVGLLDVVSKNSYEFNKIVTSSKNPISILSKLKKLYDRTRKDLLSKLR